MSTIVLRQVKGTPLTVAEVDTNFSNLDTDKLEKSGGTMTGAITFAAAQFGTNVNTFLTTPSSANLLTALTDETGTGSVVFSTSPTLVTPILGTPTSGNFSTGTFTWPTFNQNTSGTAGGLSSTLVVGSGGTGLSSVGTSGNILTSNGTVWVSSAPSVSILNTAVTPGTSGNVLTSNGTSWISSTPAVSLPSQTGNIGKYLKTDGTTASWTDTLTAVKLSAYQETVVSVTASTATTTLDMSLGSVFVVTISANTAFAFSNFPANTNLSSFTIITVNDATAGRAVTWPAAVTWAGGLLPARTTTANKSDAWAFFTINAGTKIVGSLSVASY